MYDTISSVIPACSCSARSVNSSATSEQGCMASCRCGCTTEGVAIHWLLGWVLWAATLQCYAAATVVSAGRERIASPKIAFAALASFTSLCFCLGGGQDETRRDTRLAHDAFGARFSSSSIAGEAALRCNTRHPSPLQRLSVVTLLAILLESYPRFIIGLVSGRTRRGKYLKVVCRDPFGVGRACF